MATLEDAIIMAARAHSGQHDAGGTPYLLHPLRMLVRLPDADSRIVAALHDVVGGSEVTLDTLRQAGFAPQVIEAIDYLSRRDDEQYLDYVRRAAENPLARRVKRLELEDNMNTTKGRGMWDSDRERLQNYEQALAILNAADAEALSVNQA